MKIEYKTKLDNLWKAICDYADELGAEEWEAMEEAYCELENVLDNDKPMLSHHGIIQALENDCETIAWKVWCYEDIINFINEDSNEGLRKRLDQYGITPEDVALYGDTYWKALGDCSDYDWEIIGHGIFNAVEDMVKEREVKL